MSAKSSKRLLRLVLIALAGTFLPAFPEKMKELMEIMNKARIVESIPADSESAEDILERYIRRRKKHKKEKKRKKRG